MRPNEYGQNRYSDKAIELALPLRLLFRTGLRQTQGFLLSLLSLAKLNVEIPHYSTLCRRAAAMRIKPHEVTKFELPCVFGDLLIEP